jgi:hypothetical protein
MAKAKKTHTFTVTVSAPAWMTKAQVKKDLRILIGEGNVWGHKDPESWEESEIGDIKPKRIV